MTVPICRYGEQEGYEERVMLIYDGLHYDALAVAAFEGAPEELDITVLQVCLRETRQQAVLLLGCVALVRSVNLGHADGCMYGWMGSWEDETSLAQMTAAGWHIWLPGVVLFCSGMVRSEAA